MHAITSHDRVPSHPAKLLAVALVSISCLLLIPAISAASAGFGPLSGPGGCLQGPGEQGTGGCGVGNALIGPSAVAVSPDGANVYVTGGTAGATVAASFGSLVILKRDPATGAISEVGCWSSDGTNGIDGASGACTPTPSLLGADGVAVSANGLNVFVTSSYSGAVVAFARNPTDGSLTRLGCLQSRPVGGFPCRLANVFPSSEAVVTGSDSRSLYIAAPTAGAISALTLPPAEPESTPLASESTTLASVFDAPTAQALADPCIAVNGYDGACAVGVATQGLDSLTLSPDGKQLYATAPGSDAIDVFTPGPTGALTETSCLKVNAPPGLCSPSRLMTAPTQIAISPDGRNVYAADSATTGAKVDVFSRNPTSGALSESSCVDFLAPEKHPEKNSEDKEEEQEEQEAPEPTAPDSCTSVPGLQSVSEIAVSGDGSSVYAIGDGSAVIFSRDPSTGKLTEASCADSEDTRCTSLPTLDGVDGAAVSPDGREVYVTAKGSGEVMVFGLGAAVTTARASASTAGLTRVGVVCPAGLHSSCAGHVVLLRSLAHTSAHGGRRARVKRIGAGDSGSFVIRPGAHASISVRLSGSSLQLLLSHRRLRLMAVVLARPTAGGSGYGRPITLQLHR